MYIRVKTHVANIDLHQNRAAGTNAGPNSIRHSHQCALVEQAGNVGIHPDGFDEASDRNDGTAGSHRESAKVTPSLPPPLSPSSHYIKPGKPPLAPRY